MEVPQKLRLKSTIKYPTTIIVGGINKLGLEIAESLIEQGGYVVIIDSLTKENIGQLNNFPENSMISFLDYTSILTLEDDIRRLDYVFYFAHTSREYTNKVSTQEFLTFSNYLDAILSLCSKFEARFLLTTSIKAHQLLFNENELLSSYSVSPSTHTTYTDMELQRYAEGLTLEYHQKVGLNARITRLGQIIGDGVDLTQKNAFNELILEAVKGEPLKLQNDGLENEWFVHVLDCSYGLIKAMFSKNTDGQSYSVCYENTYSQISIAYKIQELEDNAKEIRFAGDNSVLPPLKIHKPAPNLTKIGWLPRVSFDKAVMQSLASAKIFLIEQKAKGMDSSKGNNIVGRLKSFMSIAETGKAEIAPDESEAKHQGAEEMKRAKMGLATERLNYKRRRRSRTRSDDLKDSAWGVLTRLTKIFGIFRNKSPLEIGMISFLIALIVFLYFTLFSPFLIVVKDVLVIMPEVKNAQSNIDAMQFDKFSNSVTKIDKSLLEMQKIVGRYRGVANFLTLGKSYGNLYDVISTYELYASGASDISKPLSTFSQYIKNYQNNTQIRLGTDSFLSLTNNGVDYSQYLDKFEEDTPFLDVGIQKIDRANSQLSTTELSFMPSSLSRRLKNVNEKLLNSNLSNKLNALRFIPKLLGNNAPKSYLVVALDNTRPTPVGGELAAFALITVADGSVTEITVQSFDEVNLSLSSVSKDDLSEINARRFNLKDKSTLKIADLTSIYSFADFSSIIGKVFQDNYQRNIDGVVAVNLSAFENILSKPSMPELQVEGVTFDKNNSLISNLNATQPSNENLKFKRNAIAQIFAAIIFNDLDKVNSNFGAIYSGLSESLNAQNIYLSFNDTKYSQFISENDYDSSNASLADSFATVAINTLDPKIVNVDRYPSANIAAETQINSDYSLINKVNVHYPLLGTSEEVSICLPFNAVPKTLKVLGVDSSRVITNTTSTQNCLVATVLSESDLTFTWRTKSIFAPNSSSNVLSLGIGKLRGANTTLDYKITNDPEISAVAEGFQDNTGSIIFTKSLLLDEITQIQLGKQ